MAQNKTLATSDTVQLLKIYSIYRLVISVLLAAMYIAGIASEVLGVRNGTMFLVTACSYFVIALTTHLVLMEARGNFGAARRFAVFTVDLFALALFSFFSGGSGSSLGYLSLMPVAAGSIVLPAQLAYLLAALATISFLGLSISGLFISQTDASEIFTAGLLGGLLFLTATVFLLIAKKIKTTQTFADQRAREASELQLLNETIIKRMRTGILVIGTDHKIKLINSAAIQLLGNRAAGIPIGVGLGINQLPELKKQYDRWRDYPWLRTPPFSTSSATPELQANFANLKVDENQQVLIFLEDIRTLSQHAQQLKLAALGRLTGSIAHEIRNPLGAISHAAQLLQESAVDDDIKHLSDIVCRHSERVNQIVKNVLRLSSQNVPQFQKLWLQPWLSQFHSEYLDTQTTPCEIEIEHLNGEFQVTFDAGHLTQILTNLLENALRYSEQHTGARWAKITTGIDVSSDLPYLSIKDHGEGVPKQHQEAIFEPFFTTSADGSGLGLYISRELCATNFATLSYVEEEAGKHYFKIGYSHPEQILPRNPE